MIIINQDKNEIINFSNVIDIVITDEDEKGYSISAGDIKLDDNYRTLGYYKDIVRAKEVLREIVERYEHSRQEWAQKNIRIFKYENYNFTYEMPKG